MIEKIKQWVPIACSGGGSGSSGGSGSTSTPPPSSLGTVAGTYTFTITGTIGTITGSTKLAVTVQ
jgi:hypothetical protein